METPQKDSNGDKCSYQQNGDLTSPLESTQQKLQLDETKNRSQVSLTWFNKQNVDATSKMGQILGFKTASRLNQHKP